MKEIRCYKCRFFQKAVKGAVFAGMCGRTTYKGDSLDHSLLRGEICPRFEPKNFEPYQLTLRGIKTQTI